MRELLDDTCFIERHKVNPKHFVRDRVLTFRITFLFLISVIKESVQSELDSFFGKINCSDTKTNMVSGSAFTQARKKLKHTAFIEMDHILSDHFYKGKRHKTWKGFRLVAIDGSSLRLPSTEETRQEFGINEEKAGQKIVVARISEAFDPLNHITIDACIAPFKTSEHEMMLHHVKRLNKGDIAIYDRNYPGYWVYKLHQHKEINFCFRIQIKGRGKYIDDFIKSGKKEAIVEIRSTEKSKEKCKSLGLDTLPIKCRLVRVELNKGDIEVLVTSLLDMQMYPHSCFKELYHLRWGVEEDYKLLKCRVELGNFSGKSSLAIYQDFYAKILLTNLASIIVFDASKEIEEESITRKYNYKINWNNVIQNMRLSGFLLFIRSNFKELIRHLHYLFKQNPIPFRPKRTFERKKSAKNRTQFSMCYK